MVGPVWHRIDSQDGSVTGAVHGAESVGFRMDVEIIELTDDGQVPNNPNLGLVLYRGALAPGTGAGEVIRRFVGNGWGSAWVNGIFAYHHYHARAHEVLANVGEAVEVQFGGASGPLVTFEAGDVVVIPAGGGHCRVSGGSGLVIVGAYPAGQENYDLSRADNPADYVLAHAAIARVGLPALDPVTGERGPLLEIWRSGGRPTN
jgi:uncharacterized protein YjlB